MYSGQFCDCIPCCFFSVPRGSYFSGRVASSARVEAVSGISWDGQDSCNGLGPYSLEMCYRCVESGLDFLKLEVVAVGWAARDRQEKIASQLGIETSGFKSHLGPLKWLWAALLASLSLKVLT